MQPKVKQTEKEKRNLKLENENENKLLKEHTKTYTIAIKCCHSQIQSGLPKVTYLFHLRQTFPTHHIQYSAS